MGSVHLSGVESLSRRYLTALSRCPFPCFAAVRRALDLPLGDVCVARMLGRARSVEEVLKVCENHPDSLVGRSPMRLDEGEDEYMAESGTLLEVRSARVRGRGIVTGSTITGGSSVSGVVGGSLACLSLIPRNLAAFRGVLPGLGVL